MTKARDLANIISGGFTVDDIPNLPASKITSGTFDDSRVAASNVTQHSGGFSTITASGEIDAGSLDVSGDADIDGTLEADAITVNGVSLAETISDTVGAMVSSNTETNITVTYDDSDNTLDFAVDSGISNGNLLAANANVADNDFLRIDGTSVEGRSAAETLSDIGASPVAGSSSIVTTGALDSGSITSGFGTIDTGSSTITTTGAITGGSLVVDNFTLDGTELDLSSGDLTVDVAGDIILDADGGDIEFKDNGVSIGKFALNNSGYFDLYSAVQDADVRIRGNDGGSTVDALTIDMSNAGAATFNNNVTAYSDERLKSNIETIDGGLAKILSMRGVTYTRDDMDNVGVIAQEVEKVLPQIVMTADDEMGTKSVDYSRITAVLIEAVKELTARVEELENK